MGDPEEKAHGLLTKIIGSQVSSSTLPPLTPSSSDVFIVATSRDRIMMMCCHREPGRSIWMMDQASRSGPHKACGGPDCPELRREDGTEGVCLDKRCTRAMNREPHCGASRTSWACSLPFALGMLHSSGTHVSFRAKTGSPR